MLPSILARELAPQLGTVQNQPISLGAKVTTRGPDVRWTGIAHHPGACAESDPDEPRWAAHLTPTAPRPRPSNDLFDLYKNDATPAQKTYIDSLVTSQSQARNINQNLLNQLSAITDNSPASQILAAITLIQMKVTPVVCIHIPFSGDNHTDNGLVTETAQTISGVASIASLMAQLQTAGLSDQVTFATLNVFGRTMGAGTNNGRDHNPNHQVSLTIGKPFKGGVIGGVTPVNGDYGCTAINSSTGASSTSGDILAGDTLASFGQTLLAATGVNAAEISTQITSGKIVSGALA